MSSVEYRTETTVNLFVLCCSFLWPTVKFLLPGCSRQEVRWCANTTASWGGRVDGWVNKNTLKFSHWRLQFVPCVKPEVSWRDTMCFVQHAVLPPGMKCAIYIYIYCIYIHCTCRYIYRERISRLNLNNLNQLWWLTEMQVVRRTHASPLVFSCCFFPFPCK